MDAIHLMLTQFASLGVTQRTVFRMEMFVILGQTHAMYHIVLMDVRMAQDAYGHPKPPDKKKRKKNMSGFWHQSKRI